MADPTSEITFTQSYDPYGVVTSTSGDSHTEFGFTGEQYDSYIKLIYLRSRMYDPASGRFTSRDIWDGDVNQPLSLNRWIYVEGNPVNYIDPSGYITEKQGERADLIRDKLQNIYGVYIKKDWGYMQYSAPHVLGSTNCMWQEGNWRSAQELELTLEAVKNMSKVLGGAGSFRAAMRWQPVKIYRVSTTTILGYGGYSIGNVILPNWAYDGSDLRAKRTVVHELAHVWDARHQLQLGRNMMLKTNSFRIACSRGACSEFYDPANANEQALTVNNSYAETNEREDWAVSFEYFIYPGSTSSTILGPIRKSYIENVIRGSQNP